MYNGEHSITFGDGVTEAHTWRDWHLIPTSRPTLPLPSPQQKFVDIPGRQGGIDISDYLTSNITFQDRSGSFEFIVENGHENWMTLYEKIAKYLHGKRMWMTLDDDPAWSFQGRFNVGWSSEQNYSKVTISYRVFPFKESFYPHVVEDMNWDRFNFETSMDYSVYSNIVVTDENPVTVLTYGQGYPSFVGFVMTEGPGPVSVTMQGVTKTATEVGDVSNLIAVAPMNQYGTTEITITGNGTVSLGWEKKSL